MCAPLLRFSSIFLGLLSVYCFTTPLSAFSKLSISVTRFICELSLNSFPDRIIILYNKPRHFYTHINTTLQILYVTCIQVLHIYIPASSHPYLNIQSSYCCCCCHIIATRSQYPLYIKKLNQYYINNTIQHM